MNAVVPAAASERIDADNSLSLDELAVCANAKHDAVIGHFISAAREARGAGAYLIRAKHKVKLECGHGHWIRWLEANCPDISVRTAQTYMDLAIYGLAHPEKGAELDLLAFRDALAAIRAAHKSETRFIFDSEPAQAEPEAVESERKRQEIPDVEDITAQMLAATQRTSDEVSRERMDAIVQYRDYVSPHLLERLIKALANEARFAQRYVRALKGTDPQIGSAQIGHDPNRHRLA